MTGINTPHQVKMFPVHLLKTARIRRCNVVAFPHLVIPLLVRFLPLSICSRCPLGVSYHRQLATYAPVAPTASNQDDSRTAAACSPLPIHLSQTPEHRARPCSVAIHCCTPCGFDDTFASQRLAASTHMFGGFFAPPDSGRPCIATSGSLVSLYCHKQLLQPETNHGGRKVVHGPSPTPIHLLSQHHARVAALFSAEPRLATTPQDEKAAR